jgi:hypothetical protein
MFGVWRDVATATGSFILSKMIQVKIFALRIKNAAETDNKSYILIAFSKRYF